MSIYRVVGIYKQRTDNHIDKEIFDRLVMAVDIEDAIKTCKDLHPGIEINSIMVQSADILISEKSKEI